MATINATVKVRETEVNTLVGIVTTINAIHGMIIDSGMIQVANDAFVGQAGIFTAKATPSVGETKVVHAPTTGALGERLLGYKVYKHPTLSFYIKVNYINYVGDKTASIVLLSYQIGRSLVAGGFELSSVSEVIYPMPALTATVQAIILMDVDSLATLMTVSCGPEHFWISRERGVKLYTSGSHVRYPTEYADFYSIGIFSSSKDPSTFCIVLPQPADFYSAGSGLFPKGPSNALSYSSLKYMVFSGSLWTLRENGAAGSLADIKEYATSSGTRVAQAELIIGGEQHRFNFGFINKLSAQESGIVNVNLTGVDKRYQAVYSMGCANPALDATPIDGFCIPIFPTTL